jgi:hypothetical protein
VEAYPSDDLEPQLHAEELPQDLDGAPLLPEAAPETHENAIGLLKQYITQSWGMSL